MLVGRGTKTLLLMPAVIWVLVFTIFPLLYSLRMAFYTVRIGRDDLFVGFNNFARAFQDQRAIEAAKVTLGFIIMAVALEMVLGLTLALLFNAPRLPWRNTLRALMVLPLFATPVAVGYLFFTIFYEEGGLINAFLPWKVPWLSHPNWALVSIALVDVWQWTPFTFLVLLAALQSIPSEMYEAAIIDTSSRWDVFRNVVLPALQPTLIIVFLLRLTEAVKVFDIPFSLTGGGPGTATQVFSLFAYRTGLRFFDLGYASALAYLLLICVMVVVTIFFGRIRQIYE